VVEISADGSSRGLSPPRGKEGYAVFYWSSSDRVWRTCVDFRAPC